MNKKIVKKKENSRTEKVYAVVPKSLKDAFRTYVASIWKEDKKATESEIINRALEEYLEIYDSPISWSPVFETTWPPQDREDLKDIEFISEMDNTNQQSGQ